MNMTKQKEIQEKETKKERKSVKEWISEKKNNFLTFCGEHPQIILPIISGIGMLVSGGIRLASEQGNKRLDSCKVRDDVTEEYFLVAHPMTNTEILELGERMIDGESKGRALNDMGLLRDEKKRK